MNAISFIITLTGSSGCGKTYITDRIIEFEKQLREENIQFKPKRHWKFVTRPYREMEIIDKEIKGLEIDVQSVKKIPDDCEFIYRTYGDEYGFRKRDLQEYLDKGESPIIVINDVRVVEELKKEFPNQVLSLFLFREIIPDVETHKKAGLSRGGVSKNKIISRFEKAIALHRVFIENIFLFDRVILNVPYEGINKNGEKFEDIAKIQAEGIIRGVIEGKISLNKKIKKNPKLFIISGNAQSGKDDIIRAAKKFGKQQTDILIKYTNRKEEDGDDGEIICKYKPNNTLILQYEKKYISKCNQIKDCPIEKCKKVNKSIYEKKYNEYIKKIGEANEEKLCSYDKYCETLYNADKNIEESKIKTKFERFWESLKNEIENKGQLSKDAYNRVLEKYFELNPEYIDLEEIARNNEELYKREIAKIDQRIPENQGKKENNSGCLQHKGKSFVLYENNKKLYDEPIYYGYEIDKYVEQLKNGNKHIVLTASLPNMFKICREHFGQDNVVTAYTYSQISQKEHAEYADRVTGAAKLQEYDDILRYAYHISDFNYALIYAETSAVNKTGNQKDELVDQMFRLFRVYNNEKIENKNKLFVLSGPSATGKSTILKKIIEEKLCNIAPKFSNRKKRNTIFDDITFESEEFIYKFCNEVNYEMYNNLYGFNIDMIKKELNVSSLIAICSDFDSIRKIRNTFEKNFSAIFIYLQDISIENFLKAYIERKNLEINGDELFLLANKLSESLKIENKIEFAKLEDTFQSKMKEHLSSIDFEEFDKRYKWLIYYNEGYIKNKYLFNHTISGKTLDELLEKCREIIRR